MPREGPTTHLGAFHRLSLHAPGDDPHQAFELRVTPDGEQREAREESTVVIVSPSLQALPACLREPRVTGYARYLYETAEALPRFEYRECTADDIVASLRSNPLSRFAQVTLIAADTSITEMRRRLAALTAKTDASLEIRAAAAGCAGDSPRIGPLRSLHQKEEGIHDGAGARLEPRKPRGLRRVREIEHWRPDRDDAGHR